MSLPFEKKKSVTAGGVIAVLALYNFLFAFVIGIPLPHMVIQAYVQSVDELGDAQVRAYNVIGDHVATMSIAASDAASAEFATALEGWKRILSR